MCDTCDFIRSVFEFAQRDAHANYMPVIMLLKEMEKQKRIVLYAGDCPLDEISYHLGEEVHYTIRHYFKCIAHSRFFGESYFFIGACIRGKPCFEVLDSLKNERLTAALWGNVGSMFR